LSVSRPLNGQHTDTDKEEKKKEKKKKKRTEEKQKENRCRKNSSFPVCGENWA
jgi:hypothetical protein